MPMEHFVVINRRAREAARAVKSMPTSVQIEPSAAEVAAAIAAKAAAKAAAQERRQTHPAMAAKAVKKLPGAKTTAAVPVRRIAQVEFQATRKMRVPWTAPDLNRSQRVITFLQELTISSGEEAGQKLALREFQLDFIREVYREDHNGGRPVRTAVLSLARKNGKSSLAAGLALCHLCGPEREAHGEVYSCANDRFQASKIFHEMYAMICAHPWLSARTKVMHYHKTIYDLETGSMFMALSHEASTKMGVNPSFVVYDEYGQSSDDELFRAMDSAMGARKDPLLMVISTQAADDAAPFSRLIDYGLKVKAGEIHDPSVHLSLYCADPDDNPWEQKTWKKANPALDDFRSLDDVKRLAAQARRMPGQENSFRNLILNQRVAAHMPFILPQAWKACGGEANIPDGVKVFAALDLGSTRDMSALLIVAQDGEGVFHVQPHFWLPGNVEQRESQDRAPYQEWIKQGFLTAIGDATDPKIIALKIAELNGKYKIQTLAFDRWRINDLKRELDEIGCDVKLVPHGQGFKDMTPAVDILERLVIQKRIKHGNHPVLAMNAACAIVTRDPAGGRKLDKAKSRGRIDGLVALAMAFTVAMVKPEPAVDVNALIG